MLSISIHAPREGSDCVASSSVMYLCPFQSTLPARGATNGATATDPAGVISIHAPREGSDGNSGSNWLSTYNFNPRSPRGERLAKLDTSLQDI